MFCGQVGRSEPTFKTPACKLDLLLLWSRSSRWNIVVSPFTTSAVKLFYFVCKFFLSLLLGILRCVSFQRKPAGVFTRRLKVDALEITIPVVPKVEDRIPLNLNNVEGWQVGASNQGFRENSY